MIDYYRSWELGVRSFGKWGVLKITRGVLRISRGVLRITRGVLKNKWRVLEDTRHLFGGQLAGSVLIIVAQCWN